MGISPLIEAPHGILDLMTGRPCGANFVGRTQELAQILEAVDRAERGEPGLVLIGGEAGIGKTRLVEEAGHALTHRDVKFAVGACVEFGVEGVPLAPLAQILRTLLSDPRLARLSDTTAESALAGLLLTSDVRNPAAPQRAFHTILSLIEKIAKTTTAVLIFEDIQDADSATAALLTFLTRSLRDTRVLLIATYRSGLHRARPRMSQLLADLERQRLTEHMELGRFRRTEVAAQLQALLGREVEEALMQQIYARAEGNPYFTEVLARGLSEPDGALPSSLRDLLISRIYRLPDDTHRILHIIAAGGLEVRHDVLAAVADLPGPRLAEALRPAVTEGVIDLNADHTGYRFHHALAHEAVEQDVLPGERVALHLAFAQALESAGTNASDDNATEIARHLYAAHNIHRAFPMLLRAAEVAASRYAYAEELQMLERALELWPLVGSASRPQQTELLYRAVLAASRAGHDARAIGLAEAALRQLGDEPEDAVTTARFLIEHAESLQRLGRSDGIAELERAIDLLDSVGAEMESLQVHSLLARFLFSAGQYRRALQVATAGIQIARRTGRRLEELDMRITEGWCLGIAFCRRQFDLSYLKFVREEAVDCGDIRLRCRATINYTAALTTAGRAGEALELLYSALAEDRAGLPTSCEAMLYANTVEALLRIGSWDEASAVLEFALDRGYSGRTAAALWCWRAEIAVRRGRLDDAATFFARIWQLIGVNSQVPEFDFVIANVEVEIARSLGRIGDARNALDRVVALDKFEALDEYVWPLIIDTTRAEADHAELCRSLGVRPDGSSAASIDILSTLASVQFQPVPGKAVYAAITKAEIARWNGIRDADSWHLARMEAVQDGIAPHIQAYVLFRCAECELQAGNGEQAAEFAAQAREKAEKLGLRPLLNDLDRIDPDVDTVDAQPEPDFGDLGLTPRELEVLQFVAEGRTNGQIGKELFITTKTASTHVSKILNKLGVKTRTEAAAAAHRLGLLP